MEYRFMMRLKEVLKTTPFDTKKALALSIAIHDAEANGYEVPKIEDNLWKKLTEHIEQEKELSKYR